jgi:hypothetical protein
MVPHRWTARCSVASLLDPDMFCLATFLNEHSFDAPAQGREQLLLETGDRPHAAAQRDFAGHGVVDPTTAGFPAQSFSVPECRLAGGRFRKE